MASSNRHWPSMYRSSLACNFQQPQPQPDMNNGGKSSLMSSRCEENGGRNPEPRPRWNPRPEQIRILEGIFNSGMVNPPRDEIRRIRLQLQEYGPVGDANVFYWFQNRKSRTKHKLRAAGQLQPSGSGRSALQARACAPAPVTPPRNLQLAAAAPVAPPTSSSSSSSDRSSGSSSSKSVTVTPTTAVALASPAGAAPAAVFRQQGVMPTTAMDLLTPLPSSSAALAARQLYYQYHSQIMAPAAPPMPDTVIASPEQFLPQWQQGGQQHYYLPATELGGVLDGHSHHTHEPPAAIHRPVSLSPSVLFGLCNEALRQDYCADISVVPTKGLGHGHQFWNSTTCGSDMGNSNSKIDAVSAVIRDDEKSRLGLLHYYGLAGATTTAAAAVAPAPLAADAAAGTATLLPSSAASDQLQGLLDAAGLLMGETPPTPTATVVAVARDAVTCAATATAQFSVPASMRLDVRLAFGEAALLARHTGEAVPVDESGVTVEPLQQDTLYYVLMATNN
ncbi:WUSCHEL-related homeobox 12 isoform 2 [Zea mays]|uniref:Homeobox domain-containing protein n=1 Tax=Zea mays TaxID=4577 RepID=A0A804Q4Y0_MAIZE|eukprot:XP_008650010.1 WUSCHEL-related homeobox 12-like isoform X1 [Zea mays]